MSLIATLIYALNINAYYWNKTYNNKFKVGKNLTKKELII